MKKVSRQPSPQPDFDQALEHLRAHSFDIAPFAGLPGSVLASKDGVGAVLVARGDAGVTVVQGPGTLIRGELARLVDRGYQKFLKTSQGELPATAAQLHVIHDFGEELRQITGGAILYNEALGTTSDLYVYDRLEGREEPETAEGRQDRH
jgi:hypothetical protein